MANDGTIHNLTCCVGCGHQFGKQGVSLVVGLQLCVLIVLTFKFSQEVALGFNLSLNLLLNHIEVAQHIVSPLQHREHLAVVVGSPELQRSGTLQELTHTLGLFHAGQLHQETARVLQPLNVGLCHTKAVDTATEHVVGVCNCALSLLAEHLNHLVIAAVESNLVFHHLIVEDDSQGCALGEFVVGFSEEGNEVALRVLCSHLCLLHCGEESGVSRVVRQGLHNVFHSDFQHHVHTAFEVQTEVNLFLFYLFVGELLDEDVVDRFRFHAVEILLLFLHEQVLAVSLFAHTGPIQSSLVDGGCCNLLCGIFGSLFLNHTRHYAERKLVGASNRQDDCHEFDKSFVLHCLFSVLIYYLFCLFLLPFTCAHERIMRK